MPFIFKYYTLLLNLYEFSHLELFNFNLEFTSLIIYTKNTNILLRKDESIMELKNLLESTEVCPDNLSEKQIEDSSRHNI